MQEFLFWWSVISTALSVIFLGVSIWQIVDGRKQKERSNAQVKIWMQDANGITQGLSRIIQTKHSTVEDVCAAIWALHSSSFALYQSLFEERAVTEDEFKEQQKRIAEEARKSMEQNAESNRGNQPGPAGAGAKETGKSSASSKKRTG